MPEKIFLKDIEVSERFNIGLSTLRNDRMYKRGIPYVKLGRSILYDAEDCHEFLTAHKIQTDKKN